MARRRPGDIDLRLPASAMLEREEVPGFTRMETVAPKKTAAGSAGAIPRLDDFRSEGPFVDGHQQRFDARSERFRCGGGRQVREPGEFGATEAAHRRAFC